MPGGFHPFHAGHYALYQSAVKAFPNADVYVAATNDQSERPFPFALKEKLAKLAGVAPGHFVQVKSPFQAKEITQHFNPNEDVLIFVRSEKDRNEPPQAGGTKKDGSPAYFQPWTGKDVQPFAKHAYMAYLPTVEFGPGITSATQIRKAWPTLNDKRKLAMVMSLYPAAQKNSKLAQNVVGMFDQVMAGQVAEDVDRRGILKALAAAGASAIAPAFAKGGGGGGRASGGGRTTVGRGPQSASHVSDAPHSTFHPGSPFYPVVGGHGGGTHTANDADKKEYIKFLTSYADAIRAGKMTPEMRKWLNNHPEVIEDLKRGKYGLTMGQLNADLLDIESRKNYHMMQKEGVAEGFGPNYPGTYEEENKPFQSKGSYRITDITTESVDYLDEK